MTASETDPGERAGAEGGDDSGSNSRRDPLIGSVVNGKYRVHSAIARGGMGRIYYATQEPLGRPVALKVVQGDGDNEAESQFLKRFLQEASILAKLQHPNVVTLFDYGPVEGSHVEQYFIAMEFLAGETLTHRFKTRGRMTAGTTLVLTRQIVRGLREAHKHGIVHRDLKPSNIILLPEGDGSEIVKLVDFGIGKVMNRPGDSQDLTQDGVFVGTPRYMAPEQFEGSAYPASDLYALGTIMFQALAGRLPFDGQNMAELMVAKLARQVPTLREVAPDIDAPQSLVALVYHLLARNHGERPTMEELVNHLMICEEEVFGTGGAQSMRLSGTGGSWPKSYGVSSSNPQLMMGQSGMMHGIPAPSGSNPSLVPSSTGPHNAPLSRVPPTLIAPIPNVAHMTPTPRPGAGMPMMPGASDAPGPRQGGGGAAIAIAAVALVVVLFAGIAVWWKATRTSADASGGGATTASAAASASAPGGGTGTPNAPSPTFTLAIESAPPGAAVWEGETYIGTTPINVSIDRASIVATPRTFTLKHDGFIPTQVVQGTTTESTVHSVVALAPDVTAKKTPPGKAGSGTGGGPGGPPGKPTATGASSSSPGSQPGLDIRMKR